MSHNLQIPDDIYAEVASYAAQHGQTPDTLLLSFLSEGVELLKQGETPASIRAIHLDEISDPLASFIGAFESGEDDPGWIERHDEFFADSGEIYGNKQ